MDASPTPADSMDAATGLRVSSSEVAPEVVQDSEMLLPPDMQSPCKSDSTKNCVGNEIRTMPTCIGKRPADSMEGV
ncbi:hypothetical protein PVAP13_5KG309000 [Panicum virgatum]|uniref:Uncharacterized protein n=1 Tax=Panicum virgatum TaxID=38727 RepID=A0A8T0SEQ5_PANVG|nr:hypothetical protein PVAP13_5KG309000 [Panicum virgatum]